MKTFKTLFLITLAGIFLFAKFAFGAILFDDDFSTDKGWTYGTEWGRGPAIASSGEDDGFPDPASDHSPTIDEMVAGAVIGGNVSIAVHGFYYLTSPVIDCSSVSSVTLSFWRWLNSDWNSYMTSAIEVYNGSSWVTIFTNPDVVVFSDNSWVYQEFDVSSYASGNANFQVRFGHNILQGGAYIMSGWNIDDVVVAGGTAGPPPPTYTLPFTDDFSTDKDWTGYGSGGWTRGMATAGISDDPDNDNTPTADDYIIGNYLGAQYPNDLPQTYWLTSPVFNCSGKTNVKISFYRWLGVENNWCDYAYLEVYNGAAWVTLWSNSSSSTQDTFWWYIEYDVSAYADNNANFQVRFGLGATDGSVTYSGWNIDDFSVTASGGGPGPGPSLFTTFPFIDNFTSSAIDPLKWNTNSSASFGYVISTNFNRCTNEPSPPYALELNGDGDQLTSLYMDTSGYKSIQMSFYFERGGLVNDPEPADFLRLYYFNNTQWTQIWFIAGTGLNDTNFTTVNIVFPADACNPNFAIRWTSSGTPGLNDYFFIDNIAIQEKIPEGGDEDEDQLLFVIPELAAVYPNYVDLAEDEIARIVIGGTQVEGNTINAEILVYTMRGVLVKEYPQQSYIPGDYVEWDGAYMDTDNKVAAGIYIVVVKGDIEINIPMIIKN